MKSIALFGFFSCIVCFLAAIPVLMQSGVWFACNPGSGCTTSLVATKVGPFTVAWAGYCYASLVLASLYVVRSRNGLLVVLKGAIPLGAIIATGFQLYALLALETVCPWCLAIALGWICTAVAGWSISPSEIVKVTSNKWAPAAFGVFGVLLAIPPATVLLLGANKACKTISPEYARSVAEGLGLPSLEGRVVVFLDFGCPVCTAGLPSLAKDTRLGNLHVEFVPVAVKNVDGNSDTAALCRIAYERGYGYRVVERPPNPTTILDYNQGLAGELQVQRREFERAASKTTRSQRTMKGLGLASVPSAIMYENGQLCRVYGIAKVRKLAGLFKN